MSTTDQNTIAIPCPNCGHETKKSLGWLQEHSDFTCAECGLTFQTNGPAFADEVQRAIEKGALDLKGTITRLNRLFKSR